MIDISTFLIKDLSVADSDSHKFVAISHTWITIDWVLKIFGSSLPFSVLFSCTLFWLVCNSVRILCLFDLSELIVFVKGWLSNRNHMVNHIPKDTFWAWNSCQRPLVGPSSVEVKKFNELVHVQWSFLYFLFVSFQREERLLLTGLRHFLGLSINQVRQESVVEIDGMLMLRSDLFFDIVEVGIWHAFENESQNTVAELRAILNIWAWVLVLHLMDNMHLQV